MHRSVRILITMLAAIAVAAPAAACGTQKISIPKSDPNYASDLAGAQLFQQRCAGCHTFCYAGTRGSAANIRSAEAINGPNFNIRCERPSIACFTRSRTAAFRGLHARQRRRRPAGAGGGELRRALLWTAGAADSRTAHLPAAADRHASGVVGSSSQLEPGAWSIVRSRHVVRRGAHMLDIKLIRAEPETVRAALARRGEQDAAAVDRVLELDERWRAITARWKRCAPSRTAPVAAVRGRRLRRSASSSRRSRPVDVR